MRLAWFLFGLLLAAPIAAQERDRAKKPAVKKQHPGAHKKPTPEQIRRFNERATKQKKH